MSETGGTPGPDPVGPFAKAIDAVTAFVGSANGQKIIGLAGGAGLATDVKTWTAKLAFIGTGGAFALAVHYVDYLRAKIGRLIEMSARFMGGLPRDFRPGFHKGLT